MMNNTLLPLTPSYRSILQVLAARAGLQPDTAALTYLDDGEDAQTTWTYAELWSRVSAIALQLSTEEVRRERVLLLYSPGLEYIAAFFGVMLAEAIAVPSYPPLGRRLSERLQRIVASCSPRFVLTTSELEPLITTQLGAAAALRVLCTDKVSSSSERAVMPAFDRNAVAMIQYTSGSTDSPKGVVLTHENILANCQACFEWLGPDPERKGCIWLPPYHDMGLLGGVLQPLYAGFPLVFMSPMHFVQRPVRWLRAISKHRVTLSGAPTFGYQLCARDIEDEALQGLDLSCWREAFCGAEPIRPEALRSFARRMAPHGFSEAAMNPCYGLAEATLLVSGKPAGSAPNMASWSRSALERGRAEAATQRTSDPTIVASCGVIATGLTVKVVDRETLTECEAGQIGELWIQGATVSQGYWNQPEQNARVFGTLAGCTGSFLRTGDLGFIHDHELYITGRCKDLIIIAGRNHYPEDIERSIEGAHPAVQPSGVAAFSLTNAEEGEQLVVAVEIAARAAAWTAPELVTRATAAIVANHGIAPHDVVLCKRGAIPRTTSGKIRRSACQSLYQNQALSRLVTVQAQGS